MMSGRRKLPLGYSPELECRILELPFTQRRISFFVVLPDDSDDGGLARLEANMTSGGVKALFSTLREEVVNVRLPRFRVASEADVGGALRNLGVTDIFDPDRSDLKLMAPEATDLHISSIAHK